MNKCHIDIVKKIHLLISSHLSEGNVVKIMWVPGHSSIEGNEKKICKLSAYSLLKFSRHHSAHYFSRYHKNDKTHTNTSSAKYTSKTKKKLNEIKSTILHWPNYHPDRKKETIINRLRIGRTRITHGHSMSRDEPPSCMICGVALTVKHILTECFAFAYLDARNHNHLSIYTTYLEKSCHQLTYSCSSRRQDWTNLFNQLNTQPYNYAHITS